MKRCTPALSEHQRIHRQIPAQLLYGLPFGEFLVLKIIRQLSQLPGGEDKVTASQIHSLGGISKPGISQILNSLENKELIRREIDKRDRRAIAVSLTPKGESVIQDAHKIFKPGGAQNLPGARCRRYRTAGTSAAAAQCHRFPARLRGAQTGSLPPTGTKTLTSFQKGE